MQGLRGWVVRVVWVDGVVGMAGVDLVDGVIWVLRTKTSLQEEQQEQLHVLLDLASARLVKNLL